MQYRDFGNTGFRISRLGFGAMRLPMTTVDDTRVVDEALAIPMIHAAFERGVNYIDTAYMYCDNDSEVTVGRALKGRRDQAFLSTKFPFRPAGLRAILEEQLAKLDTDYIDLYYLHGVGQKFLDREDRDEVIAAALQAKADGLIRHFGFSFHDKPEVMATLIDLGCFEAVLCQYNFLDRANEAAIANAKARGLGTVVMGPVGGGRLSMMDAEAAGKLGVQTRSTPELAFRFVFSNPNVDCAISGMSTMEQVLQNVEFAANADPLDAAEVAAVTAAMEENKRLADLYCTGCNYCIPHCPREVAISKIFSAMNYNRVYGLKAHAQKQYDAIGSNQWNKGAKADACVQCGVCEEHCPQNIAIREQLKECQGVFGP